MDSAKGKGPPTCTLTSIERQAVRVCLECNNAALGEVENISRNRVHGLASLVADLELALKDDLHFVIGICVDKWCAFFEPVKSA